MVYNIPAARPIANFGKPWPRRRAHGAAALPAGRSKPRNKQCTCREIMDQSGNVTDTPLRPRIENPRETVVAASWRSGYAADCKSVYRSSILLLASINSLILPRFYPDRPRNPHDTLVAHFACVTSDDIVIPET